MINKQILWATGNAVIRNVKKLCMHGRTLLCFCLIASLLSSSVVVNAETVKKKNNTLKVGWYEDSYHITGEDGSRSGYAYEYEQALASYTGWDYKYVHDDWSKLLEKLQRGEIDLMSDLSYTEDRAKTILYSDQPMGKEKYYLYADLSNWDITNSDVSTLNGKPVILMKKSIQGIQFQEWEKKNNVKTRHIYVDSIDQAKELFSKHEAVGVVSSETSIWVENGLSAIFLTGGSDIYFGINKNRPDLKKQLDAAMASMEQDKPFYADELYEQYLATQSVPALTSEEQDWLNEHGKIRMGFLNGDTGFSSFDVKNGILTGVINDYIQYARNFFNQTLKFEVVGFETQEEEIDALHAGKIDMIFNISRNPYFAEEEGFALSNTVLTMPVAVMTTQDAFNESAENTVAVDNKNKNFIWYILYNYPKWNIIECDSIGDAERKVRTGKADCFIVSSGQSMEYTNDKDLHSVFLTKTANSCFAVNRGDVVLLSILNKTLKSMQTSKLTGALSMYEDSAKKVTVTDFIKDNLVPVTTVFVAVVLLILMIILRLLKKARKAEEAARLAQLQAENANAAKSNFLFNMSHDIRTPMNALLGYNHLLKSELTDPKLLHYQKKMEQSGNLLLSIINNVLDMARIESGKMELDENCAVVEDIMCEITEVFDSAAKKKGINLITESTVEHQHIMCDVTKIKQLYVNLLSNAIKYTPSGGTVALRIKELPCDKKGYVTIHAELSDTGIGMSKEFLPTLFDAFSRERNTTMGRVAGTGLGMSIVKELVNMMGGSIDVESELGKGTTFIVNIRHRIADEKYYIRKPDKTELANDDVFAGKHILIAEDNDMNSEIAMTILESMGFKVDRVEDGVQCVDRVERMPAGSYDLILMDIQMPNMDGYDATEAIRLLPDKHKADIPIVAMTANAFEEDRTMAISKGMNEHIGKPIDIAKVKDVLVSVLYNSK